MKRRGVNIRVISDSTTQTAHSAAVRDALAAAEREGILTVLAAGNDSLDQDVFSSYPHVYNVAPVLIVANSDQSDGLAASPTTSAISYIKRRKNSKCP
jgi:subtilisin family serine protease